MAALLTGLFLALAVAFFLVPGTQILGVLFVLAALDQRREARAGHGLEDRNRRQLYEPAKEIRGRSGMGKWELIDALRGKR